MALLDAESFDYMGTNLTNLVLRGYQLITNQSITVGTSGRTGTGALRLTSTPIFNSNRGIYKILDQGVDVLIIGYAYYVESASIAGENWYNYGIGVGANSVIEYKINFDTTLGVSVWSGVTKLGASAANTIALQTWQYLEAKISRNVDGVANTGSIEVRISGQVVLTVNGLNIPNQISRHGLLGGLQVNDGQCFYTCRFDDWYWCDNSGDHNNDYLGDRRCVTSYPNADQAPQQWAYSSGATGYNLIDEAVPDDGDYIQANNAGDITQFQKEAIGIATNDIAGAVVIARTLKIDAGISSLRLGIQSGVFVENGPEQFPGTSVGYLSEVFERNPNGNIPWTKTALDAANIRFTREQ